MWGTAATYRPAARCPGVGDIRRGRSAGPGALLAALGLVLVTTLCGCSGSSGPWPYRTEPLQFGVTTPGGPRAADELDGIERLAGERPALVLSYADFSTPPPLADLDAVAARGATPVLTWEPWDWSAPAGGRVTLRDIAAGDHDAYVRGWADALRHWGRPVHLRFAHEQNGDWYPWAVGVGGTTAADHVAAWRHLHQVFEEAGAGNVEFVWNPNVRYPGSTPLSDTWPGARYVDRVAVDGYNWGSSPGGSGWQEPDELFDGTLDELRELAPGTPITVAEVGCAEAGGDKAAWIRELVAHLDRQSDVTAFVWFEHDKEADWRFSSSPAATEAMRGALAGRWGMRR